MRKHKKNKGMPRLAKKVLAYSFLPWGLAMPGMLAKTLENSNVNAEYQDYASEFRIISIPKDELEGRLDYAEIAMAKTPRYYEAETPIRVDAPRIIDNRDAYGELEKLEKLDYRTSDFNDDSDTILLARMIYGEARGLSKTEKIAVAHSAVNRLEKRPEYFGDDLKKVLLKHKQYSCFNKNDENRKKMKDPLKYEPEECFKECYDVAYKVLSGEYEDPTDGATYYLNPAKAKHKSWTKNLYRIGRIETEEGKSVHVYYRDKI